MTQAWRKAEESVDTTTDTGDILAPLGRVFERYLKQRNRLVQRQEKEKREFTENERKGFLYSTRLTLLR
jgi:hypothetical protein